MQQKLNFSYVIIGICVNAISAVSYNNAKMLCLQNKSVHMHK